MPRASKRDGKRKARTWKGWFVKMSDGPLASGMLFRDRQHAMESRRYFGLRVIPVRLTEILSRSKP